MITPLTPPRQRIILILLLVWAGWFVVNLAANGWFYIAAHGVPGLRLSAEHSGLPPSPCPN